MRISDWSSDVCSSDLGGPWGAAPIIIWGGGDDHWGSGGGSSWGGGGFGGGGFGGFSGGGGSFGGGGASGDRKSVVEGKSVSVRVDLGGRRSITQKKTKQHKRPSHLTVRNI